MKSIIRYAHRRDYTQKRQPRIRVRTLIRNITDITLEAINKPIPRFHCNSEYRCYESSTWSLYAGIAKIDHVPLRVKGWSFNENIPLYWGCDIVEYRPQDYSAWGWLEVADYPRNEFFVLPRQQPAARLIARKLGQDALENFLGN